MTTTKPAHKPTKPEPIDPEIEIPVKVAADTSASAPTSAAPAVPANEGWGERQAREAREAEKRDGERNK